MTNAESTPPPDPTNWWKNPDLQTWADKLHAGMVAQGIPSENQLAQLSARMGYGQAGHGIDRSTFGSLRLGKKKEARDHTIDFLVDALGGTRAWWRSTLPTQAGVTSWRPPAEANSPFATQELKYRHSGLIRAIHQQSAEVHARAYTQAQHDLLHRLRVAGWDVTGMDEHVVDLDVEEVARIRPSEAIYAVPDQEGEPMEVG